MLITPSGESANNIDPVMALAIWSRVLLEEGRDIYPMGMGKPTYPLVPIAPETALSYWFYLALRARLASATLSVFGAMSYCFPERQCLTSQLESCLKFLLPVVDYGDPQGELSAREKMAEALSRWYSVDIQAENVLFTVGGSSGIRISCEVVNKISTVGTVLTTAPYYTLYKDAITRTGKIFGIPIMSSSKWTLTAEALEKAIKTVYERDGRYPVGLLFCDPNNPLGTMLDREELLKIAEVLSRYPDIIVILDEAYAEMRLNGERLSLFSLANADLQKRIILLRSATKALSASGERMAVAVTLSPMLMNKLIAEHVSVNGHAPISLQIPFAESMNALALAERHPMISYYERKVRLVERRLARMGVTVFESHKTTATFYVIANLKDFIGTPFSQSAKRAIKKQEESSLIESDEEIAYHLLFDYGLMVCPLSYFGPSKQLGYVRITSSLSETELTKAMDLLETALNGARMYIIDKKYQLVFGENLSSKENTDVSTINKMLSVLNAVEREKRENSYKAKYGKNPSDTLIKFFANRHPKNPRYPSNLVP